MCGSGGGTKKSDAAREDIELKKLKLEQDKIKAQKARERQEKLKDKENSENLLNTRTSTKDDVLKRMSKLGINPQFFKNIINDNLDLATENVDGTFSNLNSTFQSAEDKIFEEILNKRKDNKTSKLEDFFGTNFEEKAISDRTGTAIRNKTQRAAFLEALADGERLRDRGVINDIGFKAGKDDLISQRGSVAKLLDNLQDAEISRGRNELLDLRSEALADISNLTLRGSLPISQYDKKRQNITNDFLSNFESNFSSIVPDDLFDNSEFLNIAGKAQGPQNFKFDPSALNPFLEEEEDEEDDEDDLNKFFNSSVF